jgi:hypothetical protein
MRDAIRRALASPPPRGAIAVVVAGLLVTVAAVLLSRNPGQSGTEVEYQAQSRFPESRTVVLGHGGNAKIVDGLLSNTAPNEEGDRLFTIEVSLRARAGAGAKIDSVRCQVRLPTGVHFGQSQGRRAAFPRPLADTADDAIKEGVPVDFPNGEVQQAGVALRNTFFKYVIGGNPSLEWPNLAQGQHVWLWRYSTPVKRTRDNFAMVLVAHGGETVPLACTPEARGIATERATPRTSVKLR